MSTEALPSEGTLHTALLGVQLRGRAFDCIYGTLVVLSVMVTWLFEYFIDEKNKVQKVKREEIPQ